MRFGDLEIWRSGEVEKWSSGAVEQLSRRFGIDLISTGTKGCSQYIQKPCKCKPDRISDSARHQRMHISIKNGASRYSVANVNLKVLSI